MHNYIHRRTFLAHFVAVRATVSSENNRHTHTQISFIVIIDVHADTCTINILLGRETIGVKKIWKQDNLYAQTVEKKHFEYHPHLMRPSENKQNTNELAMFGSAIPNIILLTKVTKFYTSFQRLLWYYLCPNLNI